MRSPLHLPRRLRTTLTVLTVLTTAVGLAASGGVVTPAIAGSGDSAHHPSPDPVTGTIDKGAPASYDSGLARTPYLGWNTYFGLGGDPTEAEVRSVADHLVTSGLAAAGYRYVWIDGNWAAPTPRNTAGQLVADPDHFPSGMAALAAYIHARGLLAGIYTDAGPYIAGQCGLGSHGHYDEDVRQFARWGFDALKADWLCGRAAGLDPETAFRQLGAAIRRSPRPMLFNLCNPVSSDWGGGPYPDQALSTWSYTYAPTIADSWRTYTDVGLADPDARWQWQWVLRNLDVDAYHPAAAGPGHYNDPDYLVPMRPLPGGGYELSFEESRTQLGMWAMLAAPLIIGSDPRALPAQMIDALRNPEIIAVDQDPLVRQGVKVADPTPTTQVWSRTLTGSGSRAVALLNRGDTAMPITVTFADVALGGPVVVRDLWARATVDGDPTRQGTQPVSGGYTATVPAHGVAMLRLSGADAVPGADLGGTGTASPALVRFDDTHAVAFTRGADGGLLANTRDGSARWGTAWQRLGGPVGGRILGQPAAYGSAGGRIDVFVRGTDDAAWQRSFVAGRWGRWRRLGGNLTDAPAVAFRSPDDWTLVARGTDGLLTRTATGGWVGIGAPAGLVVHGRPTAAVDGAGTVHVAVRTSTEQVWSISRTGTTWAAWTNRGGTVSGNPTMVAAVGRVYLFVLAADDRLWQQNIVDGAWGGWFRRGEFATAAFGGAVGAAEGANGSAWVVVRGVDGHVHQTVL